MSEIKADNLYVIVGFLVPGLIYTLVRLAVLGVKQPRHADFVLTYLVISLIYLAVYYPISLLEGVQKYQDTFWLISVRTLVAPALLGFLSARYDQRIRWLLFKIGANPLHHQPTAWDYKFSKRETNIVKVTMNDGGEIYGIFSSDSFVSSDPFNRDIYIEYLINGNIDLHDPNRNSILIAQSQIKTIEFTPYPRRGDKNE